MDMSSDDNEQDFSNYNFASDGFRNANASSDMYLATGGKELDAMSKPSNSYFLNCSPFSRIYHSGSSTTIQGKVNERITIHG